jgi:cytoskeletal protein CcmA (bactofilin family)
MADEDNNEQHEGRGRGRRGDAGGTNSLTLGPRDSLIGALRIEGDLRLQGTVEGEVHASGDVTIEPSAKVKASIEGGNVNVTGNVTGNVTARGRLTLAGSGTLHGDVRVSKLAVEDGATLNGNVSMSPKVGGGSGAAEPAAEPAGEPAGEPQPEHAG